MGNLQQFCEILRLPYADEQKINKQVLNKPDGEFIQVALNGEMDT